VVGAVCARGFFPSERVIEIMAHIPRAILFANAIATNMCSETLLSLRPSRLLDWSVQTLQRSLWHLLSRQGKSPPQPERFHWQQH